MSGAGWDHPFGADDELFEDEELDVEELAEAREERRQDLLERKLEKEDRL